MVLLPLPVWVLSVLSATALAAPSRPFLQLQSDGSHLLKVVNDNFDENIPHLTSHDFETFQEKLSESVDKSTEAILHALDAVKADLTAPPRHHAFVDFSQYTILEILNASLQVKPESVPVAEDEWSPWPKTPTDPSELPFHKLGWIVNYSVEAQQELAKDGITLLAPDDTALTPPHRRGQEKKKKGDKFVGQEIEAEDLDEFSQELPHPFYSEFRSEKKCRHHHEEEIEEEKDEIDDESRRAHISKVIGYLIKYTTLPKTYNGWQLANHSTVPTSLQSGFDNPEPIRLRVEPKWTPHPIPHPTLAFNFYAYKRGFTIKAKNGIIHTISAPLLPPLSPLNKLFLFPQIFSTLTSDVQKVGLADALLPSWTPEDDKGLAPEDVDAAWSDLVDEVTKEKGSLFTIFAPTNLGFGKLGPKLLALLHSPFPLSKTVLKYVLAYHVVPDITFYTDYVLNKTSSELVVKEEVDVDVHSSWLLEEEHEDQSALWELPHFPRKKPEHEHQKANITHYKLPTLLVTSGVNPNGTLHVGVVSFRRFGKGPLRRALIVFPQHPHHDEHHDHHKHHDIDEDEFSLGEPMDAEEEVHPPHGGKHHRPPRPRPIRIWKADVVARNGAIHVTNSLLKPPFYHHKPKEELKGGHKEKGGMRMLKGLFA